MPKALRLMPQPTVTVLRKAVALVWAIFIVGGLLAPLTTPLAMAEDPALWYAVAAQWQGQPLSAAPANGAMAPERNEPQATEPSALLQEAFTQVNQPLVWVEALSQLPSTLPEGQRPFLILRYTNPLGAEQVQELKPLLQKGWALALLPNAKATQSALNATSRNALLAAVPNTLGTANTPAEATDDGLTAVLGYNPNNPKSSYNRSEVVANSLGQSCNLLGPQGAVLSCNPKPTPPPPPTLAPPSHSPSTGPKRATTKVPPKKPAPLYTAPPMVQLLPPEPASDEGTPPTPAPNSLPLSAALPVFDTEEAAHVVHLLQRFAERVAMLETQQRDTLAQWRHKQRLSRLEQLKTQVLASHYLRSSLYMAKPSSFEAYRQAEKSQRAYETAVDTRRPEALLAETFERAKMGYAHAWQQVYVPPLRPAVQGLWLDRGTLVNLGNSAALKAKLAELAKAGFNTIFIETVNAGFTQYPDSLIFPKQNPLLAGWDPLAVAVEEGHKLGLKVHAWFWCFAAGNTRHNKILGLPESYAGPLLEVPALQEAQLLMNDGTAVPKNQHEYWLNPASSKAQTVLVEVMKEVVNRYAVDGVQLDYIRYPFQSYTEGGLAGFDELTKQRVRQELGLRLQDGLSLTANQKAAFVQWKANQVSGFVKRVSKELKEIKPSLVLSAAVFPMPRDQRMAAIQQDWERWVKAGWIDWLIPMTYTRQPNQLSQQLQRMWKDTDDALFLLPGLGAHQLDDLGLMELAWASTLAGTPGRLWFSSTHVPTARAQLLAQTVQQAPLNTANAALSTSTKASSKKVGSTGTLSLSSSKLNRLVHPEQNLTLKEIALKQWVEDANTLGHYLLRWLTTQSHQAAMGITPEGIALKQLKQQWEAFLALPLLAPLSASATGGGSLPANVLQNKAYQQSMWQQWPLLKEQTQTMLFNYQASVFLPNEVALSAQWFAGQLKQLNREAKRLQQEAVAPPPPEVEALPLLVPSPDAPPGPTPPTKPPLMDKTDLALAFSPQVG